MFPTLDLLGTRFARSQRLLCAALTALADKKGSATDPHLQHMTYHLTITTAPRSVRVRITGDLDYQTTDDLVEVASQLLTEQNHLRDLHLDFSEMAFLDSAALSGLLLLHRRTSRAGVALHLDHRPAFLDRILQVTGLFDHFDLTRTDAETSDPNLVGQASSGETGAR